MSLLHFFLDINFWFYSFFGEEPPMVALLLQKMGYEVRDTSTLLLIVVVLLPLQHVGDDNEVGLLFICSSRSTKSLNTFVQRFDLLYGNHYQRS